MGRNLKETSYYDVVEIKWEWPSMNPTGNTGGSRNKGTLGDI